MSWDEVELLSRSWGWVLILPRHRVRPQSASSVGPVEIWRDSGMSVVPGHRVWPPSERDARALLGDDGHASRLRRLLEDASFGLGSAPSEVLERALMERFMIVRIEEDRYGWDGPAVQHGSQRPDERDEREPGPLQFPVTTDWIEVELLDEDGGPISGVRYVIVSPDSREHRGRTDAHGIARLKRIPSGECSVTFLADNDAS